jgi:hypothetical protein
MLGEGLMQHADSPVTIRHETQRYQHLRCQLVEVGVVGEEAAAGIDP